MKWMSNPVLRREITSRMRSWRGPGMVVLYVALLGLVTIGILSVTMRNSFSPETAAVTFDIIATVQFVLLLFAAPGVAAGAVSGERERQTLDLILTSPLSRFRIVWGKLVSALAYLVLLLVASLPLYGLLLYMSGLSLQRVLLVTLVNVVTALWLGGLGLYFSTLFQKTIPSMVVAYAVAAAATAGYTLGSLLIRVGMERPPGLGPGPGGQAWHVPAWFMAAGYLNPISALMDAAGGPFGGFITLYRDGNAGNLPPHVPYWAVYTAIALGLSALLLWRTTRRLAPSRTGR